MAAMALLLLVAAPLQAAETEILLEEGHIEVQLKGDVLIEVAAGTDLAIGYQPDGAMDWIAVRRGSVRVVTTFANRTDFEMRIGARRLEFGRGVAMIDMAADGSMQAVMMSGDPMRMDRRAMTEMRAGDVMRMDAAGAVEMGRMSMEEMQDAADDIRGAAPPRGREGRRDQKDGGAESEPQREDGRRDGRRSDRRGGADGPRRPRDADRARERDRRERLQRGLNGRDDRILDSPRSERRADPPRRERRADPPPRRPPPPRVEPRREPVDNMEERVRRAPPPRDPPSQPGDPDGPAK